MGEIDLTETEKAAKKHIIKLVLEAAEKPCDVSVEDLEAHLPNWFDAAKFKRGQKYFYDNRFGMMISNQTGLLTLLAEPRGLKVLDHTGKSSTSETAKKRYIGTILHMISWYELDLSPGSKSWKSLNQVRKMHYFASKSADKHNLGFISQLEMSLTMFGFMGYALIRPHVLGIQHDNNDDREAFVHFWATIGYMLGINDEYNICLFKLEIVEMICKICLRYIFVPLLQFETPLFRKMVKALVDGLDNYTPFSSYESQLFMARRTAGIPGYQYDVDHEKESTCRAVFTKEEIDHFRKIRPERKNYDLLHETTFEEHIPVYNIVKVSECFEATEDNINNNLVSGKYTKISENKSETEKKLRDLLDLKHDEELVTTKITNEEEWKSSLNDSKFYELPPKVQNHVKLNCTTLKYNEYKIGRFMSESVLSMMLFKIRRASG